jgi:glutathione S-transferase
MLTLYHSPKSRSSRFIWLLEELGARYQVEYVTIARQDGSDGPDSRNPHPDKKVPALIHDGVLVTESAAIAPYLTDLYPKAGIGPQVGDPTRGPYLAWLAYYAGVIEPVLVTKFSGVGAADWVKRSTEGQLVPARSAARVEEGLRLIWSLLRRRAPLSNGHTPSLTRACDG